MYEKTLFPFSAVLSTAKMDEREQIWEGAKPNFEGKVGDGHSTLVAAALSLDR
jgi:hypothetical protein